jgi:hypothetical protein
LTAEDDPPFKEYDSLMADREPLRYKVCRIVLAWTSLPNNTSASALDRLVYDVVSQLDLQGVACDSLDSGYPNKQILKASILRFLNRIVYINEDRAVIVTTDGYVGLSPNTVEEGDLIAILSNHPSPIALRERNAGEFQVFGDLYVEGVMHGEIEKDDTESEVFTLV